MNIPKINPANLKKIEWRRLSEIDSRKVFSDTTITHPTLGDITMSITKQDSRFGLNKLLITAKNSDKKILGKESLYLKPEDKTLIGFNIVVEPEYRRKGLKLGELLRIFSVMEMVENNISQFEIFSKNTAVYFHSKYKFKPNTARFDHRNEMLKTIAKEKAKGFEVLAQKAKNLIDKLAEPNIPSRVHREVCKETNELTAEYIKTALKTPKPEDTHVFDYGFDMIFTKENLLENKEFYNKLFEKYKLDYRI